MNMSRSVVDSSYAALLEKTRIPQTSLQKLAVIAIFEKFRSTSPSDAGRDAISRCLRTPSPAVVDQATRELCRLVKDSKLDVSAGLLELQSALEESSNPQLAGVFVRAIGLLCRIGFQEQPAAFRFYSSDNHPFVKILSCGIEVQPELVKQIIIFITKCKHIGMEAACGFLGTFLNYSLIKLPMVSSGSTFVRNLTSTLAAFCCSSPQEAVSIFRLFLGRLKFIPCKNAEDVSNVSYIFECLVDAYQVVLRQLIPMGLLVHEAQVCGLEMLDAILYKHRNFRKYSSGVEEVLYLARHLLAVQKELGLNFVAELSSVIVSLFEILIVSEFEHEQYSVLKLVLFLLQWKSENATGYLNDASASDPSEELLFIFPVLALVSSPSTSIKQVATDLLSLLGKVTTNLLISPLEKKQRADGKDLSITSPGYIVFRLLRNLWFEDELLLYASSCYFSNSEACDDERSAIKTWTTSMSDYCWGNIGKHKSASTISVSEENFLIDMPQILSAVSSVLLLHQKGNSFIDLLAAVTNMQPKMGVPLLLLVLFYSHMFCSIEKSDGFPDMLLKLLGLLPSVASHPASIPLILQILLPMLQKDMNLVLKATAIRLISKTWEINDRVFESLQGILHPNALLQDANDRGICISIATSIQDVCKRNPDRGVDIISSVAACIENHDPLVQSLGLQSLSHLCEADVIDFYTAWDVIAQHVQIYLKNAVVSYGLSLLLRWGAMDAEAYPEAAKNIVKILWDIGTHQESGQSFLWKRAQEAAFTALMQYEVDQLQRWIPDFSVRNMELLISQADPELLTSLEEFEIKIINYQHITRRRFVKQKKVSVSRSKIVKLLDVVPGVIFGSGSDRSIKVLPGAALLCLPTPKDLKKQQGLGDVHAKYEDAAVEISKSLELSRNILLALLSLQSWKPFMKKWLGSCVMVLEAKSHGTVLDKTSKVANDILKILTKLAETEIPRSAENIALAVGAFCQVLPASAHALKSAASTFLLNWLSQYEHEYRQWSAAVSLGLISSSLHATDHQQKFKNINTLLQVAKNSKSTLVKAACGIGLGFSSQDLLTRVDSEVNTKYEKESFKVKEIELLGKIIGTLVQMISRGTGSASGILKVLAKSFPLVIDDSSSLEADFLSENIDKLEEDPWGIAGPIIGIGNCLGAIYRAGGHDAVIYIKNLIISWLPSADALFSESIGACLALPTIVSFCYRVELLDDDELSRLVSGFLELHSGLLSTEQSDTFHLGLLVASCAGAGSLISIVLNAGLHSVEVKHIKGLLEVFRRTYSSPNLPFIHLGGMLGVINAMGSGAGTVMIHNLHQKEQFPFPNPVLPNHDLEMELTTLIQEIFIVAQNSDDPQLQQYAAWAVSFLRHSVFSRELSNEETEVHNDHTTPKPISQGFSEDSLVMKLSLWLMQVNFAELGTSDIVRRTAFALHCLSHAPRLPSLDWGALIRRCMKYGGQFAQMPSEDKAFRKGILREECFLFLLSHSNQSDTLLGFLDELTDLARFKTLEINLQSLVLLHLANLLKIYSSSRVVKLFDDVVDFLQGVVYSDHYNQEQKISLRVACWKGLQTCLNESAIETLDYSYSLEHCMEILFTMLPLSTSCVTAEPHQANFKSEWTEAIGCLGKARESWLSDLLSVSDASFKELSSQSIEVLKRVLAKAVLVRIGAIPLSELARLKAYILDIDSEVIWYILVEIVATLQHSDESVRRQWLVDAVEILCVTRYPSTALRFIGLLCGSCCKYMPILVADKWCVLSDLPATVSCIFQDQHSGSGWSIVAESIASYLCRSTERIHDWARHVENGSTYFPGSQPIDHSEVGMADFLFQVMHQCCVSLREYLPPDKQLRLANMLIT
ncbi:protein RST1 isoform X2 [Andrographis paniculata]|uniref:protein RST1 isoform X2 n=1 Tax=Andrographis paniculata TaxID=175694 RepID=UPI0021E8700B|nr:protein RST1 isoform X2 [Andrographis paniculata]